MSGTREGGIKTRDKNYARHGQDYYQRIGRLGGKNGHTGGFASSVELAKSAGAKGGRLSKRGKGAAWKRIDTEYAEEIKTMRMLGASYRKIAQELNVSYGTMYNWAKERGVK